MFFRGWSICCVLLTLCASASGLEISEVDSHEVICSQGLSGCTMKDVIPLTVAENDIVGVQNLTLSLKLCCKDKGLCTLCLVINTEINIYLDDNMEDKDHSGPDEDYDEETRNPKASVTVCYNTPPTMPTCKKVEFMVNRTALTQQNRAKLSMVIINPAGVSFGSHVIVYPQPSQLRREVFAPSLDEVCSEELQERVEDCRVPRLHSVVNQEMNRVELSVDNNKSLPFMCYQYEQNGRCKSWTEATFPLYSVTPCMCFRARYQDDHRPRCSLSCPFTNTDFLQRNIWQNVSVSLSQGQRNNHKSMLWWNLTAPCRLEGEVWPCHNVHSCREMEGFRQQLGNGTWRQNRKGQWVKAGVFEDINLQLLPCVMVKIKGREKKLGPFCFETDRWRWSLLVVGVMLLVCLTVLMIYLQHDFVKKWVWSWRHGGFVEIGRKCHVVLLSPPDVDDGVSESVCQLGSLLCNQGFSVSVDQWSRKEQCTRGPLPWLYSQLLDSQGSRVVVVLTHAALERAEEWTRQHKEAIKTNEKGLPQMGSPYSDLFMALLCLIQADKQQGRARERFVLVKFDSHSHGDRSLPELLQGLLLFQLPSQNKDLLTELAVGGTWRGSSRRTWTRWKTGTTAGWRTKTKEETRPAKVITL